jgi:hypothetical protein
MPTKNSSDTIGNQIRDILACSTVPQPTVLTEFKFALRTGTYIHLDQTAVSISINNTERLAVRSHSMKNENSNAIHNKKLTSTDIHTKWVKVNC